MALVSSKLFDSDTQFHPVFIWYKFALITVFLNALPTVFFIYIIYSIFHLHHLQCFPFTSFFI